MSIFSSRNNIGHQSKINWSNRFSPILEKDHSYWAVHFCSVLELIKFHFQLGLRHNNYYKFDSEAIMPPFVALRDLNAENIVHTLRSAEGQLRNWGSQYFLVNYLNHVGFSLTDKLFNMISDLKEWRFSLNEQLTAHWYVTGRDSIIGNEFLENNGYLNFCSTQHSNVLNIKDGLLSHNHKDSLYNTDLFLNITAEDTIQKTEEMMGLFGEVEGNPGKRMNRKFFSRKSQHISFGINIIDSDDIGENIKYVETDYGNVVIIELFTTRHSIMYDFICSLRQVEAMFTTHPRPFHTVGAMGDIVALIHSMWRRELSHVISELRSIIEDGDQILNYSSPVINPATIIKPGIVRI